MEKWKSAVIAGSACVGILLFLKGKKPAGLVCAGIGMATLASEYPETFRDIRNNFHEYAEHGAVLLDVAARIGERIGEFSDTPASSWHRLLAG
jgi:hypothetical protein